MIKNRVKNHWHGMDKLESLILSNNIDSSGYERNYISLDKIIFIQESTFKIKKLFLNLSYEKIDNLELMVNELRVMINIINDVQNDFEMHKEDLISVIKSISEESVKKKQEIPSDIKFETTDGEFYPEMLKSHDNLELVKNNYSVIQVSSEIRGDNIPDSLNSIDKDFYKELKIKKKSRENLLSEGFSTKYLNTKNKEHFFKILNELKKSKKIKIELKEDINGLAYIALCSGDLNIVEIGYLIEMKKLGLEIKLLE
jgi:hypothetical protein